MNEPDPSAAWFEGLLGRTPEPPTAPWADKAVSPEAARLLAAACFLPDKPPEIAEAILTPFIRPGDMAAFISLPDAGKTTLAADIIAACLLPQVTTGLCLGGLFQANQTYFGAGSTIAILDGENLPYDWSQTFQQILSNHGIPWRSSRAAALRERLLHFDSDVTKLSSKLHREKAIPHIVEALVAANCSLLILDPSAGVFKPGNMNDQDWVLDGLRPLRKALRRADITSLVMTHTSRTTKDSFGNAALRGNPFGSSTQEQVFDAWFFIEKFNSKKDGDTPPGIKITMRKDRRAWWIERNSTAKLFFGTNGTGYTIAEDPRWTAVPPHSTAISVTTFVGELLALLGPESRDQASVQAAYGHANQTFYQARRWAHEQGLIEMHGPGGRGGVQLALTDVGTASLALWQVNRSKPGPKPGQASAEDRP